MNQVLNDCDLATERHEKLAKDLKIVKVSSKRAGSKDVKTTFFGGFPHFDVEVVPIKVRKDNSHGCVMGIIHLLSFSAECNTLPEKERRSSSTVASSRSAAPSGQHCCFQQHCSSSTVLPAALLLTFFFFAASLLPHPSSSCLQVQARR